MQIQEEIDREPDQDEIGTKRNREEDGYGYDEFHEFDEEDMLALSQALSESLHSAWTLYRVPLYLVTMIKAPCPQAPPNADRI